MICWQQEKEKEIDDADFTQQRSSAHSKPAEAGDSYFDLSSDLDEDDSMSSLLGDLDIDHYDYELDESSDKPKEQEPRRNR